MKWLWLISILGSVSTSLSTSQSLCKSVLRYSSTVKQAAVLKYQKGKLLILSVSRIDLRLVRSFLWSIYSSRNVIVISSARILPRWKTPTGTKKFFVSEEMKKNRNWFVGNFLDKKYLWARSGSCLSFSLQMKKGIYLTSSKVFFQGWLFLFFLDVFFQKNVSNRSDSSIFFCIGTHKNIRQQHV